MKKAAVTALACVALAGCVQSAANLRDNESAGRATFTTDRPIGDAYAIIQSNSIHCWADAANFIIAGAPPSPSRPPSIQINSILGHLMSVVDFSVAGTGTKVDVMVGYTLANKSRTASWQHALQSWLTGTDNAYCPKMP